MLWGAQRSPQLLEESGWNAGGRVLILKVGIVRQHAVDVGFGVMKAIVNGFLFVPFMKEVGRVLRDFVSRCDAFTSFVQNVNHRPGGSSPEESLEFGEMLASFAFVLASL
jgi:hypothetical protein